MYGCKFLFKKKQKKRVGVWSFYKSSLLVHRSSVICFVLQKYFGSFLIFDDAHFLL